MIRIQNRKLNMVVRIISLVFAIAVMGLIFFFSSQPGSESDKVSISLTALLFSADMGEILNCLVRKFAHMLEYMALGAPLYAFFFTLRIRKIFACAISINLSALYAVSDEIHQYFVPGRACQVSDMLLDSLGAALIIITIHYITKAEKKTVDVEAIGLRNKFLGVCSCNLTGKSLDFDVLSDDNVQKIFRIAASQKLLPVVYSTLKKQGKFDISQPVVKYMKTNALKEVAFQASKSEIFLDIYTQMLSRGAKPLCIKGIVCRSYYRNPDQRPSADEDILVSKSDWKTCIRVLNDNGFALISEKTDESLFLNSETGSRIEMHSSFFKFGNPFNEIMGDVFQNATHIKYSGSIIFCPSADDHLLYLILHAYRHFVNAGFGIRQIMDISVFAQNNAIDYDRLCQKCREAGIEKFMQAVMIIANRYFGFDLNPVKEVFPSFNEKADIEPLLEDILSGGIYGGGLSRRHAASVTSTADKSLLHAVFPKAEQLRERFTSLKKYPWLLPAIWIKRLVLFTFEDNYSGALEEVRKRSLLMKKYGS